jgi:hypothetical protein
MLTPYAKRKAKELNRLAHRNISGDPVIYNGQKSIKAQWLSVGASVLRAMAKELGLETFEVRKNPGGIAVTGDIYLEGHWENGHGIYVHFGEPRLFGLHSNPQFMFRYLDQDGKSGVNQWATHKALAEDPAGCIRAIHRQVLRPEYREFTGDVTRQGKTHVAEGWV